MGSSVPSSVSGQRVSTRGVSLPSAGSRRAWFPDVISTMKTLRLPARAHLVPYGFGSRLHVFLLSFVLAEALPLSVEVAQQAWAFGQPACPFPACCHPWARAGHHRFPGNPSYALALLQDPGRADKTSPLTASSILPPGTEHRYSRQHETLPLENPQRRASPNRSRLGNQDTSASPALGAANGEKLPDRPARLSIRVVCRFLDRKDLRPQHRKRKTGFRRTQSRHVGQAVP